MDSEYPDPDEEFDLVHADEYELLREIEEFEGQTTQKSQKIENLHKEQKNKDEPVNATPTTSKESNSTIKNLYKELNSVTTSKNDDFITPSTSKGSNNIDTDNTKKRNYYELFGDISDIIDFNDHVGIYGPLEKKPRWDQPENVIKTVLDAREKFNVQSRGVSVKKKYTEEKEDTISLRVPRWNFMAVTRPRDAQRIYVRVKDDNKPDVKGSARTFSNLLSVPYNKLKTEAEEIMVQNAKRASCESSNVSTISLIQNNELWVDKYRPRSYLELLSDESVNRNLLHWIKLWDKVVFNRNYVPNKQKKLYSTFKNKKFITEKEMVEEVDNKGFPIQRIALLTGPPGLGKTTLAHLAAKHAGYNVVEINASDERSPDAFRQVLVSSTQMKAVMGSEPRPNCLVLDEIDGAPAASIELLLKFVQGKLLQKGKKDKGKGEKQSHTCHRPVICICNEPYTPSLRSLRTTALIIAVPEVSVRRLADRLMEVSQKENLKVTPDVFLKLAEVSGCDIRSCLGALQYMGNTKLENNVSCALKDSRKGLFDSWKQILAVPVDRRGVLPTQERVSLVLKAVQNAETEKLAQGVFHNYPEVCCDKLNHVILCLQWFQFFDEILSLVANSQVWSVMPYTNYAFITWHLYLPKSRNIKLSYPSVPYEMHQKQTKNVGILTTVYKSSGRDINMLAADIAPFLPDLLCPRLRTVPRHLYSAKETDDLVHLVNVLFEFGLTFVQEKTLSGMYDYSLDPNIFEIGIFPECKRHRTLMYTVKQTIVQEVAAERLRRASNALLNTKNSTKKVDDNTKKDNNIAKTIPKEEFKIPKTQIKEIVYKDFFGRIITEDQSKQKKTNKKSNNSHSFLTKYGVRYKYKEGYSNAVRQDVIIADLL